jgi:hypothetical protein
VSLFLSRDLNYHLHQRRFWVLSKLTLTRVQFSTIWFLILDLNPVLQGRRLRPSSVSIRFFSTHLCGTPAPGSVT